MKRSALVLCLVSLCLGSGNGGMVETAYAKASGGAPSGGTGNGGTTSRGGTTSQGGGTSRGGTTSNYGGTTSRGGTSSGGATSQGGTTARGGTTSQGGTYSGGMTYELVMRRRHVGYPMQGISFLTILLGAFVCASLLIVTGMSLNSLENELAEARVKGGT
jgi:hypothetical protein